MFLNKIRRCITSPLIPNEFLSTLSDKNNRLKWKRFSDITGSYFIPNNLEVADKLWRTSPVHLAGFDRPLWPNDDVQ